MEVSQTPNIEDLLGAGFEVQIVSARGGLGSQWLTRSAALPMTLQPDDTVDVRYQNGTALRFDIHHSENVATAIRTFERESKASLDDAPMVLGESYAVALLTLPKPLAFTRSKIAVGNAVAIDPYEMPQVVPPSFDRRASGLVRLRWRDASTIRPTTIVQPLIDYFVRHGVLLRRLGVYGE